MSHALSRSAARNPIRLLLWTTTFSICRSGKTSLLWQELSDRLASPGMERSGLPWISLEDKRLIGSGPELLDTNVLCGIDGGAACLC